MAKKIVIAVMGPTGSGKSSFIQNLTQDKTIKVGHGLESTTAEVAAYDLVHQGQTFSLVDTPGFDDSHGNDDEIINGIVRWLEESVNRQQKLHGILYFHRIIDPKITGTSRANLRMFKKLCGNDNLGGIFLVTTFWNEVESKLGEQRELQLRGDANFWKPMIDQGSLIIRSKRDRAEDLDILSKFATRNQEFYTQAQKSIQEGKTSAQVSADCQESPTSDLIQRERKARELELTIERFRLEAVRAQKAKDLKAAIEREKAAQKKRQQEIERKQRLGQEKRQREQRAREDAERTREAKEEAEMRRLREQIARQQRLEREEAARQRRFAMHVCSNISLKRRKCSRCMNRMDWMGTGLWCWHCCHCDRDGFYLCQGCVPTCRDPSHPTMKVKPITQTTLTGIARAMFD